MIPYKSIYKEATGFSEGFIYKLDNKEFLNNYNNQRLLSKEEREVLQYLEKYLIYKCKIPDVRQLHTKEILVKLYIDMYNNDMRMFLVPINFKHTDSNSLRPILISSDEFNKKANAIQMTYLNFDVFQKYFDMKIVKKDNRDFVIIDNKDYNKLQDLSVVIQDKYNIDLFDIIEINQIPGNAYKNKRKVIIKDDTDKNIIKDIKAALNKN